MNIQFFNLFRICLVFMETRVGYKVVVWTQDPSGHARKGLGNNLARKCLER